MKHAWGKHNHITLEQAKDKFFARKAVGETGCWIWTGPIGSHKRYGIVGLQGKSMLAHRAAWLLATGSDAGELCVCHRCDNTLCINPDHLFLGTQKDNVLDMEAKGRSYHKRGGAHGRSKLTEADVVSIRSEHVAGATIRGLARKHGVAPPTIRRIVTNKGWV